MATTLSIKNAPDEVVARLKARAARHQRSRQRELMAIMAAAEPPPRPTSPRFAPGRRHSASAGRATARR
jgi:antitoxin FitA